MPIKQKIPISNMIYVLPHLPNFGVFPQKCENLTLVGAFSVFCVEKECRRLSVCMSEDDDEGTVGGFCGD